MPDPRILIVDDEPPTVKLLSANLKARGYEVFTAYDGLEALNVFRGHLFDLVVLDLGLPGMDGFAVCEAIRRESQVPIIASSAAAPRPRACRARPTTWTSCGWTSRIAA
jgi:DNA-binding response OmpR family regulator